MDGFNPNQSLIPAAGGSITPMSGGGYSYKDDNVYREFGLTFEEFNANKTVYEPIIKKLVPSLNDVELNKSFWSADDPNHIPNDEIIRETIETIEKMDKNDIQILVQSKNKEFVMNDESIPSILEAYKDQIDSKNIQVYFNETGLVIDINNAVEMKSTVIGGRGVATPGSSVATSGSSVTTSPPSSTSR